MGRIRMLSEPRRDADHQGARSNARADRTILAQNDEIKQIAQKYAQCEDFFYLGRQYNFPVALEGALKLKEISYIHAEGYPAAEMKHGPIAMIDEKTPTVFLIPHDALYEKTFQISRKSKPAKDRSSPSRPKATSTSPNRRRT